MPLDSHIEQLELRHQELETKLEQIMAHPSADDREINEIKRQKLQIRDKIRSLTGDDSIH